MRSSETHRAAPLDAWTGLEWTEGVQIDELRPLDHLWVRTHNSTYEIVVTAPDSGEVLVRGGARFPSYTRARVAGSTAGGTVIKRAGVYAGFRLELAIDGCRILTSPVTAIDVNPPTDDH